MDTERISIDHLTTDPANVRKHGERNLETIKASLKRFGQQKPIVVSADGVVVAGNGTLEAARALGWTEIDVVRTPLSGPEATAYAIADNRTAELAEWDDDALAQTLAALQIADEELARLAGFDDGELERMTGSFNIEPIDAPGLASGDRSPFQQMTFTLHDDQAESVRNAIIAAKDAGPFVDSPNENSNGNALARIAEAYLGTR